MPPEALEQDAYGDEELWRVMVKANLAVPKRR